MSKEHAPRRALGRGLDALLPPRPQQPTGSAYGADSVFTCPIERIVPRRDQPRRRFDEERLDELAATIAEHGLIEPLVVRRIGNDRFEIIAGERRWRASQRVGVKELPVVVKDVSPENAFELALIENLQREDLNPIEEAEAYARLVEERGLTQEQIAGRMGKSRAAIANSMRLLKLPSQVRGMVAAGELSEGHGRALLAVEDEAAITTLARKAARTRISVRKLEQIVRTRRDEGKPKPQADAQEKSAGVRDLEQRLTRKLGARTTVEHAGPGGKLVIRYASLDDLDRILEILEP